MVLRLNWCIYNVTLYLRLREQHGKGLGRVLKAKDQETFCEIVSSRLDKVAAPMKFRQYLCLNKILIRVSVEMAI